MRINQITSSYINKNKPSEVPAFKGSVPKPLVNGLSKAYEGLAKTGPFQGFIKNFSRSSNTFTHLLVAESCFLSGFYMINTLRNKKIDKEQKPQMLINDTLTLGVSTAGAYFAEDKITNAVMNASEKYFTKHKDFYTRLGKNSISQSRDDLLNKIGEVVTQSGDDLKNGIDDISSMIGSHLKNIVGKDNKLKAFQITEENLASVQNSVKETVLNNVGNAQKAKQSVSGIVDDLYNKAGARNEADKILPGFNKLKVLVIFGIIYRYLSPVVFTPIANKLSSKLFEKNKDEKKA